MKKTAIIIALVSIIVGIVLTFTTFCIVKFDFTKLSNYSYEYHTQNIDQTFKDIQIEGRECDVSFILSNQKDGNKVIYPKSEKIETTIVVENETLKIQRNDLRNWYERSFSFWFKPIKLEVYLTNDTYQNLNIKTISGDIHISNQFTFNKSNLISTSGDILFKSVVQQTLYVKTTSGNIDLQLQNHSLEFLEAISTSGDVHLSDSSSNQIKVWTTSGDIEINNLSSQNNEIHTTSGTTQISDCHFASLQLQSTSGDFKIRNIQVADSTTIYSTSGDIHLYSSDASSFLIETVSGDIHASLLSPKNFITHTTSGRIDIPSSDSTKGVCKVETTSGDIEITIL